MLQTRKNFSFKKVNAVLGINNLDCLTLLGLIRQEFSTDNAQGNLQTICEILLCEILGKNRTQLYLENPILRREEIKKFGHYLDSVFSGTPLSFILGKSYFFGLVFYLDENCFIPRPETEILVEKVVDIAGMFRGRELLIYDLCTGIGNIAISLTKSLSYCRIMATDISQNALKFACRNSLLHKTEEDISFICCDLIGGINRQTKADIIVSNPPYIKQKDIDALAENVKREPLSALKGGSDGLDIIKRLFNVCRFHLKEGGFLVFEFGHTQIKAIEKIAEDLNIFETTQVVKDYNGKNRIFIGRKRLNG